MSRPSLDATMMAVARVAARRSTCPRRAVGAVAVDVHGRLLAMTHNGAPKGHPHCIDQPCPGAGAPSGTQLDACEAVHAEINLLSFIDDIMRIDTIYVTTAPCLGCIKAIANSSCRRIVYAEPYAHSAAEAIWLKRPGRVWEHQPDTV